MKPNILSSTATRPQSSTMLEKVLEYFNIPVPEVVVYAQHLPRNVAAAVALFGYVEPEHFFALAAFGLWCLATLATLPAVCIFYVLWITGCCTCCCVRRRIPRDVTLAELQQRFPAYPDSAPEASGGSRSPTFPPSTYAQLTNSLTPVVAASSVGVISTPDTASPTTSQPRRTSSRVRRAVPRP